MFDMSKELETIECGNRTYYKIDPEEVREICRDFIRLKHKIRRMTPLEKKEESSYGFYYKMLDRMLSFLNCHLNNINGIIPFESMLLAIDDMCGKEPEMLELFNEDPGSFYTSICYVLDSYSGGGMTFIRSSIKGIFPFNIIDIQKKFKNLRTDIINKHVIITNMRRSSINGQIFIVLNMLESDPNAFTDDEFNELINKLTLINGINPEWATTDTIEGMFTKCDMFLRNLEGDRFVDLVKKMAEIWNKVNPATRSAGFVRYMDNSRYSNMPTIDGIIEKLESCKTGNGSAVRKMVSYITKKYYTVHAEGILD